MKRHGQIASACLLVVSAALLPHRLLGESKNPSDYPLRIHIFGPSETNFYYRHSVEESKGEGRANLFQGGEARGVDFNFDCSEKLKGSFGYETYAAKWKKPGQVLVVLLPQFGKTGSYFTCDLHTDVKDFAYTRHNGSMGSESVAEFRQWMVRHDYDPEQGKTMPVNLQQGAVGAPPAAALPPGTGAPPPPPQ